jgi:Flp pilus assembly protein TadG
MARSKKRGHAALEVALVAPWIFFLFAGAFDIGFYAHALISAQNAARVAAEYTATSPSTAADTTAACRYVLDEMYQLRNVRSLSTCNALPLIVTATEVTGADGNDAT